MVSVPLVGWSLSTAIQRACDAHIVTQIRNRDAFLNNGMAEGKDFTAIDSEKIAAPLYRLNKTLRSCGLGWTATTALASISYAAFEKIVIDQFHDRISSGEFDVVHRVTPLSPAISSRFLSALCKTANIPFILGPINGGVPWPAGYKRMQLQEGDFLSTFRSILLTNSSRSATLANSSAIIAGSSFALKDISSKYHSKTFYMAENAVNNCVSIPLKAISLPIKIVFVGRLVKLKMVSSLIEAVSTLAKHNLITLDIIGDGPEREALKKQAVDLGVADRINFLGWSTHSELMARLPGYDVLGFPSIRDFGGGVVLEAMASGVIPIVVDYAGPSELVDQKTGFKVPLGNPHDLCVSYRNVLDDICKNPTMLEPMRQACIERVNKHFTWDAKARKVLEVYKWVLGQRETNPEEDPDFLSFKPHP